MSWSAYSKEGKFLEPLSFSNGKTQEDIVKEVLDAIDKGYKIIFIKGKCGTGKSLVALNIAKELGRTSIVVPVKNLQRQYEIDYMDKMYVKKENGEKLNITILTGRRNHECLFNKNEFADSPFLPCTVEIKKENLKLLQEFLQKNPFVDEEDFETVDDIRRLSIAAACPYWSPVIGKDWFSGDYGFRDAKGFDYEGLCGRQYCYFKRKEGYKYYEQFMSYITSDVLVFNSKKYELETLMNRKPRTEVEIIDECDEFLDNLSNEKALNLDYLHYKLDNLLGQAKKENVRDLLIEVDDLVLGILNGIALTKDIENQKIYPLKNSQVLKLLRLFLQNDFLTEYEELEQSYIVAKYFEDMYDDSYLSFYRSSKGQVLVKIVNINLEKKLQGFLEKNKVFVMMSGTIHSKKVLENIFGLSNFKIIEAEVKDQGEVKRVFTRLERNFRYREFNNKRVTREDYLKALAKSVEEAKKPVLIHVNSYRDLPDENEKEVYELNNVQSRERFEELQEKYKQGEMLQMFKDGEVDVLYSTRCSRGVDLPGEMCRSIVFTKYPYPGMDSIFWRVFKLSRPDDFLDFYFDKARREFLQRMYRGLRSKDDWINLLSPDLKVLESI